MLYRIEHFPTKDATVGLTNRNVNNVGIRRGITHLIGIPTIGERSDSTALKFLFHTVVEEPVSFLGAILSKFFHFLDRICLDEVGLHTCHKLLAREDLSVEIPGGKQFIEPALQRSGSRGVAIGIISIDGQPCLHIIPFCSHLVDVVFYNRQLLCPGRHSPAQGNQKNDGP